MKKFFTLMAMVMMSVTSSFAQTTGPLSFNPDEDGHFFLNRREAGPQRMQAVNAKSKALRKAQANSTKAVLDSIVTVYVKRTDKTIYDYDKNGYEISYTCYSNTTPLYKYEYPCDENGNQKSYTYYSWDTAIKDWVPGDRYEYTYDDEGHLSVEKDYSWKNNEWVLSCIYEITSIEKPTGYSCGYIVYDGDHNFSYKSDATYDGQGYCLAQIYSDYSSDNKWVNSSKYENTYDANGNRTSEVCLGWKDGAWVGSWKYTYTYDENNNLTSSSYYNWKDGAWVYDHKCGDYTYDENGNQTSYQYYYGKNGEWVIDYRFEYTYNENGGIVWFKQYKWTDGEWKIYYNCYRNSYDAVGNKIAKHQLTLSSTGELVPSYTNSYYYHTFPSPALGDVNGDGTVSVVDVTKITDHLLKMSPGVFNGSAADVNGNNKIDVEDAKALSNMVLSK